MLIRRFALIAALTLLPLAARAQTEATKPPADAQQVLSTNPFGDLLKWFNAEYERKISPATTWGVSASVLESSYASAALLVRWYPQQAALDGFYLGARTGVYRFASSASYRHTSSTVPGAGLEVGRAWLLGPKRNTSVSLGFGLTRLFGAAANGSDAPTVWPHVRLFNVGVAF